MGDEPRPVECPACNGTGFAIDDHRKPGSKVYRCKPCNGTGCIPPVLPCDLHAVPLIVHDAKPEIET